MFNKNLKLENLKLKTQVLDMEFERFFIIIFSFLLIIIFSIWFYYIWYNNWFSEAYCSDKEYCILSNFFFNK